MTTTTAAARAAKIGAAIRAAMADPYWAWRYTSVDDADDEIRATAAARIREWAARARRWLTVASDAIGLPLPVGNGAGGPWQRIAVLDDEGRLGVLDIAAGRIAWTDASAPSYVRRFSVDFGGRGVSASAAGGTGGMGGAVAQIALTYGVRESDRPRAPRISPLPRPQVREIEWGLTTCYGGCGDEPTAGEWRGEWERIVRSGTPMRETSEPQWCRVAPPRGSCSVDVARETVRRLPCWTSMCIEVLEYGECGEWRVLGDRAERAHLAESLLAAHACVAEEHIAAELARARREAGVRDE